MKCEDIDLYKYSCRELPEDELQKIAEHLDVCDDCRSKHRNLQNELRELQNWEQENIDVSTDTILRKAQRRIRWVRYVGWGIILVVFVSLVFIGLDIARYRHENVLLSELEKAIIQYRLHKGEFPTSGDKLAFVLQDVADSKHYLQVWKGRIDGEGNLRDYWGNTIRYRFPAKYNRKLFDIYSCGKDGEDDLGLDDDIKNWHPLYEKVK
ncbi:type II secretion system protein GspG [Candidatus Uabimicrobium amorphum]|uniref:Type II secretion system protein GspG C-terminal domain-containing protein n=1 Tax=Uabimicrobium amorphum TaxID=2596890 RepID=A0A5S9F561_UABAM|nr:type II secretion system protein GspG [Candidatus Uabimicrobium amorphum]BBM84942.1 hypothetical protein UABAM_03303 [Candidatus Uabimicrobium amorphum]